MRHAGQRLYTKAGRSAALALLLAASLLLCHGVYGWYHQMHQIPTGAPHQHAPGHPSHEGHGTVPGTHAEGQEGECSGCAAYSAVLLVLYLGALLAMRRSAHLWTGTAAPPFLLRGLTPAVLHPARGPTLPALQVFRL